MLQTISYIRIFIAGSFPAEVWIYVSSSEMPRFWGRGDFSPFKPMLGHNISQQFIIKHSNEQRTEQGKFWPSFIPLP